MRILFTRFPLESALGGAERQTLSLMEGLLERGHAVAFAGSCPVLLKECRLRGIPTAEWRIGPPPVTKWHAVSFAWRQHAMRMKLELLLAQFADVGAIVMLSMSEKILLTEPAARAGVRVIWAEHDRIGNWLTKNPWLTKMREQAVHATTVTVSHLSARLYERLGWPRERIVTIANGVEPFEVKRDKKAANAPFRLGCVSRLSHEKGIDLLIEAMAAIPDHVTLEIVGKGREEKALKKLTRDLGLTDRIAFTAHELDVRSAYARFDALVLPSRDNDPFGMVAAEAMMSGVPVIVTDMCGIADFLTHGEDAMVAKANSPSALAQAVCQMLGKREELASAGKKTAAEKFSAKRMTNEWVTVLTDSVPPPR